MSTILSSNYMSNSRGIKIIQNFLFNSVEDKLSFSIYMYLMMGYNIIFLYKYLAIYIVYYFKHSMLLQKT